MINGRMRFFLMWIKRNCRIFYPLSFIAGCLAGQAQIPLVAISLAFFSFVMVSRKLSVFIMIILFLSGFWRISSYLEINNSHIGSILGNEVIIYGSVVEYPNKKGSNQFVVIKPEKIKTEKEVVKIENGLIQAKFSKYYDIQKGDKLVMRSKLEEPENFEEFDYREYLKTENIYALVDSPRIEDHKPTEERFERVLNNIREGVVLKINSSFPEPHGKLLAGMVLGTREEFSEEFTQALSVSGTAHVIAVSGYNIALIISALLSFSGWISRKWLLYLSYFAVFIFVGLVGFDNLPALRAGLMGFITITALIYGKNSQAIFVLSIVAALMSMQNPLVYKSISFQLSFAATLGLMVLSDNVHKTVQRFLPDAISEEFATTFTAILVTFPITFANFKTFGIFSILANILIAPFVPIVSLTGIIWLFFSSISGVLDLFLRAILWSSLEVMVKIINWIAELPYSSFVYDGGTDRISIIVVLVITVWIFESGYKNYLTKNA